MEEELNENALEERLYAMLYYADEVQNNVNVDQTDKNHAVFEENAPRSTVRRYWRTGPDSNPYQKVNTAKELTTTTNTPLRNTSDLDKPKEPIQTTKASSPVDLSILQSPVPQFSQRTIQIIEHENDAVVLESSDEDEVVEVALPPKPTITIESSEDEELIIQPETPTKSAAKSKGDSKSNNGERDLSTSPVPSVVSSVSDEFIRGDCIALNISSRKPDKPSFDFSLHGPDLVVQNNSQASKRKKKKKNKEAATSTPIVTPPEKTNTADGCFATPKSKAKNKKQRVKLFPEKTVPTPDVYDSDSNMSIDTNKNKNLYIVTNTSVPNVDVYESDSNQSEILKENILPKNKTTFDAYSSDSSVSEDRPNESSKNANKNAPRNSTDSIDLTGNDSYITLDCTSITESIVMANVTGLSDSHRDENRNPSSNELLKYVSSRVPSILNEDLDFDHLKGKEKVCRKRNFSPTTLRAEMEKFYNESWGGENFNHKKIQEHMSRDKSLWAIDPKDRMQPNVFKKPKCSYCNRVGHRDDTCRQKPPVCYMCGNTGHYEPRCPNKICLNCGAPNFMYSTMCRQCSGWRGASCARCRQPGHLASHCPDTWRRYHSTIDNDGHLEAVTPLQAKKGYQLYCSGCTKRGHLVHECRTTIPFSGLPINSPYVYSYQPIYTNNAHKKQRSKSFSQDATVTTTPREKQKRLSKSPTVHETHVNKKRNLSLDECPSSNATSPATQKNTPQTENANKNRNPPKEVEIKNKNTPKEVVSKKNKNTPKEVESTKSKNKNNVESSNAVTTTENAPDFIPISSNRDNEGHLIQDNEVSDTSDVVTTARIYVTNDIITKLQTKDGGDWLKTNMEALHVTVSPSDNSSFLTIKGKLADQEAFQTALREWASPEAKNQTSNDNSENPENDNSGMANIPKNRNNLLRQLTKALDSLKMNLGDPGAVYEKLTYTQFQHKKLMKQKVINPQVVSKSRSRINKMLQTLNTILLGQAGLADGSLHVNKLRTLHEKLLTSRNKVIGPELRKDIAQHYHRIFTAMARNDYQDLVSKYYTKYGCKKLGSKGKKRNKNKKYDSIPSDENVKSDAMNSTYSSDCNNQLKYPPSPKSIQLKKLKFYQRRLLSAMPKDRSCKIEKSNIMRRVHAFIESLQKNDRVPSKIIKKVTKVQHDAQKFLSESVM